MSSFNTTPILSNTASTTSGVPMSSATMMGTGMMPGATATTVLPQTTGLGHHHQHHQYGGPLMSNTAASTTTVMAMPVGGVAPVMHGATNVVEHQPIVESEIVMEHPVEIRREHHIQPIIHRTERQIQPIIRTEVTTERRDMLTERSVMLPAVVEQPRMATTGMLHETTTDRRGVLPGTSTSATGARHHATIGQKIKGTVKEVQGTLTHNQAKKEEGRLLKQGIAPATTGMGTTGNTTGRTTRF